MPTIHLMVGFMGFGKTTIAKELEKEIPAVRLTHDEFMVKLYGRNMPYADFHPNYKKIDEMLWCLAEKIIKSGTDVIMDYGFWSHQNREKAYERAKKITKSVIFHNVYCDMNIAKKRILNRSAENQNELYIREDEFDTLVKQYEPWCHTDDYPVVLYNVPNTKYIGQIVQIKIDRPLGSKHPKFGFEYPVNYGYIPFTKSGDGEELDAYVLMVDEPIQEYIGRCIGVVHRIDDDDDKLIIVPEAHNLTDQQIEKDIAFQEKWFKHMLLRNSNVTKTHFGVYGCIIKDDKILLIKKARGPYTGLYDLPGGSPEQGESYSDTLKREIMEETGCTVINAKNERFKSIIFSDFTKESGEKGILQHNAVLYDVEIEGNPKITGDGIDSNGAVWVDMKSLNANNATPYALMAAGLPLINVANENDEIIATHVRGKTLKQNRYPMIAAVLLFNSRGNLIMQKIAAHKKWGGLWTYSAAGHVDAGEDYITASQRELKEEMGINAEIEREISSFPIIREGRKVAYHHVFVAHSDDKITPDKCEVAEIREISLSDLKHEIAQNPEQFFDGFLEAVQYYFEKFSL